MSRMLWTWSRALACAAPMASPSTGFAKARTHAWPSSANRIDRPRSQIETLLSTTGPTLPPHGGSHLQRPLPSRVPLA
jgi:hypothetical protein